METLSLWAEVWNSQIHLVVRRANGSVGVCCLSVDGERIVYRLTVQRTEESTRRIGGNCFLNLNKKILKAIR